MYPEKLWMRLQPGCNLNSCYSITRVSGEITLARNPFFIGIFYCEVRRMVHHPEPGGQSHYYSNFQILVYALKAAMIIC